MNAIATVANIEEEKKELFLEEVKSNLGLTFYTLRKCDAEISEFNKWSQDEKFRDKLAEATEYANDVVERMLLKKITEGDTQAIIFYCETKLRHRGYFKKS